MQGDTSTSSSEAKVHAEELGRILRGYRREADLDISALATRTRIGTRYLNALEEGRLEELPGPVFVKGFVKVICEELGRDLQPLLPLLEGSLEGERGEETNGPPNGQRKVVPLVLSAVVLLVLVTGGALLHGTGGKGKPTAAPEKTSPVSALPESGAAGTREISVREEPVVELDLLIRATEKTWLRMQADSSEAWEATMKTGDEVRLKAMERISLFIGNAGGIQFELNGRRFGPLGTQGQVISNYVITRDNL